MKVKMRTLYSGPSGCFASGSVAVVSEEEGRALVKGGYAAEVLPPAAKTTTVPAQTATVKPTETTSRGKRR